MTSFARDFLGGSYRGTPPPVPPPPPPPTPLPYDINIILISGQSNSEDQDAAPIINRTGRAGVVMLDTIRPRTWGASFGSTFSTAVGTEYINSTTFHMGGDMVPAAGDKLMQLIEDEDGFTYADHSQMILPVHIGQSSSAISEFSHGTAVFTAVTNHLTAVKAAADAQSKTVGIICGAWLWGADGYEDDITQSDWYDQVHAYWSGDVNTYLADIFDQLGEDFPVGIMQTHAHGARGYGTNPYGAEAELELCEDFARYHIINPEGPWFLNGLNRGWAGSTIHHGPHEAAIIGAYIGWFAKRLIVDAGTWNSHIPSFTRVSSTEIRWTGAFTGLRMGVAGTGLPPTTMVTNYGLFAYDPATPTTEIALTRPPYQDGDDLVLKTAGTFPVGVKVRGGSRTSSSNIASNIAFISSDVQTYSVLGQEIRLWRHIPTFDRVAA